jgi:hypothetical protein
VSESAGQSVHTQVFKQDRPWDVEIVDRAGEDCRGRTEGLQGTPSWVAARPHCSLHLPTSGIILLVSGATLDSCSTEPNERTTESTEDPRHM